MKNINYELKNNPINRLKSLSSTGLVVGILGTVLGTLILIFGIYLISTVYGKGSSPLGILALYGLVLLMLGLLPLLLGLTTLIPSIISKVALKRDSIKLLKIVKIINIVQLILNVLSCITLIIYGVINGDGFGTSIMVGGMLFLEIGLPLSIFPIIYIAYINKVIKELNINE